MYFPSSVYPNNTPAVVLIIAQSLGNFSRVQSFISAVLEYVSKRGVAEGVLAAFSETGETVSWLTGVKSCSGIVEGEGLELSEPYLRVREIVGWLTGANILLDCSERTFKKFQKICACSPKKIRQRYIKIFAYVENGRNTFAF